MIRKKILPVLLSAIFFSAAMMPAMGLAEPQKTDTELRGLITEVIDGGFIMRDEEIGEVLLNVDTETVLEGVLAETPLASGMYVFVKYNGLLTRSQPPQAHADRLGCYVLEGTVAELLEDGILLSGDKLFGDAIVHLTHTMPHVFAGVSITVYYNGAMAMSKPPQVSANYIVVPVTKGTVKAVKDNSLTLVDAKGKEHSVEIIGSTLLPASWFEGELLGRSVIVYHNGDTEGEGRTLYALEIVDPASIIVDAAPLEDLTDDEDDAAHVPTQNPAVTGKPTEAPEDDSGDDKTMEENPELEPTDAPVPADKEGE